MKEKILQELHNEECRGAFWSQATYKRISLYFYWPKMKDFIKKWVQESKCCKRNKLECIPYQGLLRPLPVLEHAWQDITVDSKALPISEGKDTMLVVVDKLTKYSHFIALSHPFTTSNAELFFINIVRHMVYPELLFLIRIKYF